MNNLKEYVTGIDVPIQSFQIFLYKKLKAVWGLTDDNIEGYGRVYKNTNDKGTVPEVFIGSSLVNNTTYKPAYFDETNMSAMFFFSIDDKSSFKEGSETTGVSITFITNLERIKAMIQHRGDEEAVVDVESICNTGRNGLLLTATQRGFKNVFNQYTGLINKDGEVFRDRHPIFCFRIDMSIFFQPTLTPCK